MAKIHEEVEYGLVEDVEDLLRRGKNVNSKKLLTGNTPLHIAVENSDENMVKLLIEYDADIEALNNKGQLPLHLLMEGLPDEEESKAIIKQFIENGIDIDIQDKRGNTLLHLLMMDCPNEDELVIIKFLLENSADVKVKNKKGKTPIDVAREEYEDELVELLEEYKIKQEAAIENEGLIQDKQQWVIDKIKSMSKDIIHDDKKFKRALVKIRGASPPPFRFIPIWVLFKIGLKARNLMIHKTKELIDYNQKEKKADAEDTFGEIGDAEDISKMVSDHLESRGIQFSIGSLYEKQEIGISIVYSFNFEEEDRETLLSAANSLDGMGYVIWDDIEEYHNSNISESFKRLCNIDL
jgi:hypothetical protein